MSCGKGTARPAVGTECPGSWHPSRRIARRERPLQSLVHHVLGPQVVGPPAGLPPLGAKFLLSREPELLGAAHGTSLPLPKGVGSLSHLFLPCLVHGLASVRMKVTSMSDWAQ